MGILNTSDSLIKNSLQAIDTVLNSKFATALQGEGQVVLVDYYNIDDILSTTTQGLDTIDEIIGSNSPLRYNYVENFPISTSLKQLLPEIEQTDGNLLDLNMSGEAVIFPDTIKPSPLDYIEYRYSNGRNIVLQVDDVKLSTVRSNNYYKVMFSLKQIDDSGKFRSQIKKQVTENFYCVLDYIGTNKKAILTKTDKLKIEKLEKLKKSLISDYLDIFYVEKYNSVILQNYLDGNYSSYDPYLTQFLISNRVLDTDEDFIMLLNYDTRYNFKKKYNQSIYRNIELKSKKNLNVLRYTPVTFLKNLTNPFAYIGEETVFSIELYDDMVNERNTYIDKRFIDDISNFNIYPSQDIFESIVVKFLNNIDFKDILSEDDVDYLLENSIERKDLNFIVVPICIYILTYIIGQINKQFYK